MPPEGLPTLPKSGHLSRPEIVRFVNLAAKMGVRRVRLTGGEPLLRPDLVGIVSDLSQIRGIEDLALTTNGERLKELAGPLKQAGLKRLNVSLDSLHPRSFQKITLRDQFFSVLAGIEESKQQGFPVKVNVVVMKDINHGEVVDFARFALEYQIEVRFIEFMPLCGTGWKPELVYPLRAVRAKVEECFQLKALPAVRPDDVATCYQLTDGTLKSSIGLIPTVTEPFCHSCSRMRLSADGVIRPCLFSHTGFPVGDLLKFGASDEEICEVICQAVRNKPEGNDFYRKKNNAEHVTQLPPMNFQEMPMIRSIGG